MFYKNYFVLLKNNKAASLLEVIISMVIVGVTAATLLKLQSIQSHLSKKNKLLVESRPNTKLLMLKAKKLVSDVRSETHAAGEKINNQGVCSFATTQATSAGVAQINFQFTEQKIAEVFSPARWRSVIWDQRHKREEYKLYNKGPKCPNTAFTKCYSYKKDKDLIYQVKIKPLLLKINQSNYVDLPVYKNWRSSKIDFKTVFFKIAVTPFSKPSSGESKQYRTVNSLFWAGDVPYCSKFVSDWIWEKKKWVYYKNRQHLKLYISGTGVSTKNAIYNTSVFNDNKQKNPLEIRFSKSIVQAGDIQDGLIVVNPSLNISASMIKEKYSCVQASQSQVSVSPNNTTISTINLSLTYTKYSNRPSKIWPKFKQSFSFRKGTIFTTTRRPSGFRKKYFSISSYPHISINSGGTSTPYVKTRNGFFYEAEYDNLGDKTLKGYCKANNSFLGSGCAIFYNPKKPFFLSEGLVNIALHFLKHKKTDAAVRHCYFGGAVKTYDLVITAHDPNTKRPIFTSKALQNPYMGCTICYMKNCKRLGRNTFGPMYNPYQQIKKDLPLEPLDAALPECSNYSSSFRFGRRGWFTEEPVFSFYEMLFKKGTVNVDNKKCLSYSPSNSFSSTGVLTQSSCTSRKNPLCAAFGGRYRGKKRGTFNQANKICYDLGKETVTSSKLTDLARSTDGYVTPKTRLPSLVTNLSQTGLFLFTPNFLNYTELKNANNNLSFSDFINRNNTKYQFSTTETVGDFFLPYQTLNKKSGAETGTGNYPQYWAHSILEFKDSRGSSYPAFYWKSTPGSAAGKFQVKVFSQTLASKLSWIRSTFRSNYKAGLLINHIKGKGLLWGNPVQNRSFAFLCWRQRVTGQYTLFRSDSRQRRPGKSSANKSKKWTDGQKICQDRGGQFFPLFTGRQWTRALHLAGTHSSDYVFPDPDTEVKPLWVAFSKSYNKINLYNADNASAFKPHSVIRSMPIFKFERGSSGKNTQPGKFRYSSGRWSVADTRSDYYFYRKNNNDAEVKNALPYLLHNNQTSSAVSVSLLNTWLMKIYLFYSMFNSISGNIKPQYNNKVIEFFPTDRPVTPLPATPPATP